MGQARQIVRVLDVSAKGTEWIIKRSGSSRKATSSANVGMKAALLTASSSSNSWVVWGLADSGQDLLKRL